jgi:hypothetical protein
MLTIVVIANQPYNSDQTYNPEILVNSDQTYNPSS